MPAASMARRGLGAVAARPGRRRAGRPRPHRASAAASGHPSSAAAASTARGPTLRGLDRAGAPARRRYSATRESTERDADDTRHRPDPFGARATLGAGLPDLLPARRALADRIDLGPRPGHAQDPARERPPPRRRRDRRAERRRDARWRGGPAPPAEAEIPFMPARVLLQDFTGVPAVVDLAVMRDAMADLGGDPARVNPLVPADLVIDHSVQVDRFGTPGAFAFNVEREYERNGERYQLLRWAQTAFRDLRVVPPGTGHRPPGQPRVPGHGRHRPRRRRRPGRLPGHARRDRLAHDDGQRPRRPRLRRRRHRGRGRPARPAALPADAADRRRAAPRRAAARLDRDRPRPRRDRDAARATASSARSSSSPATGWPAWPSPTGRRSAT